MKKPALLRIGGFLLLLLLAWNSTSAQNMDNEQMEKILQKEAGKMKGLLGAWQLQYGDRQVLVVTDEAANRMRVFSLVIEESQMDREEYRKMLEANFHTALDAKYAIHEGYVVSLFTHPLRELTADQLVDAVRQVIVLAETFGTTYQSTDLIFSPGQKKEEERKINEKPMKKS